jgi:SAM-dependent methyltransferase
MWRRFRERAAAPELMDEAFQGGAELREAYRHLRRLNRLFGAARPVLYGVRRLWTEAGRPAALSVLDIGAGSGDVNRLLLRWADRQGLRMTVVLADRSEEACAEARRLFRGEPRVRVVRGDLFRLPPACADIVTATQFAHHFAPDELPRVAQCLLRASRLGVVLCDIHRHWVPWLAVWLATRLLSRNRFIRHDGPLSVAKGFVADDWRRLGEALADGELTCRWRPLFRHVAVIRRVAPDVALDVAPHAPPDDALDVASRAAPDDTPAAARNVDWNTARRAAPAAVRNGGPHAPEEEPLPGIRNLSLSNRMPGSLDRRSRPEEGDRP